MINEELEGQIVKLENQVETLRIISSTTAGSIESINNTMEVINDSLIKLTGVVLNEMGDTESVNVGDPLELKAELANLKERVEFVELELRNIHSTVDDTNNTINTLFETLEENK